MSKPTPTKTMRNAWPEIISTASLTIVSAARSAARNDRGSGEFVPGLAAQMIGHVAEHTQFIHHLAMGLGDGL
jgi:hypothetical protein